MVTDETRSRILICEIINLLSKLHQNNAYWVQKMGNDGFSQVAIEDNAKNIIKNIRSNRFNACRGPYYYRHRTDIYSMDNYHRKQVFLGCKCPFLSPITWWESLETLGTPGLQHFDSICFIDLHNLDEESPLLVLTYWLKQLFNYIPGDTLPYGLVSYVNYFNDLSVQPANIRLNSVYPQMANFLEYITELVQNEWFSRFYNDIFPAREEKTLVIGVKLIGV
jgi:hypothetical protein